MKKVLITGANGFIGSFLVEKALSLGYETWAGVRKSSNLEYLRDERIKFIDLQYSNTDLLSEQLNETAFDFIIHNAGITKCVKRTDFDRINFQYTANLIDVLNRTDTPLRKFILMSSLSAYGMGDEKNYTPIKLTDTPNPNTAYGKSKLKAELHLQSVADFPYLIFRPTGVYGPREKDYLMMLKTVKSGFNISAGFRTQHLTFVYVKDLADVVFRGLESNIENKSYFVSDGDVHTSKDYARLIKKTLNKKRIATVTIPLFVIYAISCISELLSKITGKSATLNRDKFVIMRQRNWECETQPLVNDLNFAPKYNLCRGLEESISWYKENDWL